MRNNSQHITYNYNLTLRNMPFWYDASAIVKSKVVGLEISKENTLLC